MEEVGSSNRIANKKFCKGWITYQNSLSWYSNVSWPVQWVCQVLTWNSNHCTPLTPHYTGDPEVTTLLLSTVSDTIPTTNSNITVVSSMAHPAIPLLWPSLPLSWNSGCCSLKVTSWYISLLLPQNKYHTLWILLPLRCQGEALNAWLPVSFQQCLLQLLNDERWRTKTTNHPGSYYISSTFPLLLVLHSRIFSAGLNLIPALCQCSTKFSWMST